MMGNVTAAQSASVLDYTSMIHRHFHGCGTPVEIQENWKQDLLLLTFDRNAAMQQCNPTIQTAIV